MFGLADWGASSRASRICSDLLHSTFESSDSRCSLNELLFEWICDFGKILHRSFSCHPIQLRILSFSDVQRHELIHPSVSVKFNSLLPSLLSTVDVISLPPQSCQRVVSLMFSEASVPAQVDPRTFQTLAAFMDTVDCMRFAVTVELLQPGTFNDETIELLPHASAVIRVGLARAASKQLEAPPDSSDVQSPLFLLLSHLWCHPFIPFTHALFLPLSHRFSSFLAAESETAVMNESFMLQEGPIESSQAVWYHEYLLLLLRLDCSSQNDNWMERWMLGRVLSASDDSEISSILRCNFLDTYARSMVEERVPLVAQESLAQLMQPRTNFSTTKSHDIQTMALYFFFSVTHHISLLRALSFPNPSQPVRWSTSILTRIPVDLIIHSALQTSSSVYPQLLRLRRFYYSSQLPDPMSAIESICATKDLRLLASSVSTLSHNRHLFISRASTPAPKKYRLEWSLRFWLQLSKADLFAHLNGMLEFLFSLTPHDLSRLSVKVTRLFGSFIHEPRYISLLLWRFFVKKLLSHLHLFPLD